MQWRAMSKECEASRSRKDPERGGEGSATPRARWLGRWLLRLNLPKRLAGAPAWGSSVRVRSHHLLLLSRAPREAPPCGGELVFPCAGKRPSRACAEAACSAHPQFK
jgi:hypothetical protein